MTHKKTTTSLGLILIPEYLSKDEQLSLLKSSLDEYTQPPNPLNLSTHYVLPGEGDIPFFQMYVNDPEALISSIASTRAVSEQHEAEGSPTLQQSSCQKRQLIQNEPAAVEGYQTIFQKVSEWKGDEPSAKLKSKTVGKLFGSELRWANLGWVYNVSVSFLSRQNGKCAETFTLSHSVDQQGIRLDV